MTVTSIITKHIEEKKEVKLRSMFVAEPGCVLIACDYSQAETWIVAHLASESKMIKALKYGDIHTDTAANVILYADSMCMHKDWQENDFPWLKNKDGTYTCKYCSCTITSDGRYLGKRCNHALSYKMHEGRMVQIVNADSDKAPYVTITLMQGRTYRDRWLDWYSNVPNVWWPDVIDKLNRNNRTLITCYGRRRIFNGNWGDSLFKEATAFEPQSTVADHANGAIHPELGIRGGFLEVYRQLVERDKVIKICNQSHDSIMVQAPRESRLEIAERITKILRRPIIVNGHEFVIPVDCEMGDRWGELEKIKL
jgi:DNA polymerase I-like protein with 3'-5' exonuclease and polymerase domains